MNRLPGSVVVLALCAAPAWPQAPVEKRSKYVGLSLEELVQLRITTASQQDESLRESPVPVTVVTADMIRSIGARNLLDVLLTFVPGMTLVADHNELNVAMRGIYGSSQQKILVLLDGHRLNSRAYSMVSPDYGLRIDLDRVKQIEVLRGPGSSLYGNVALTAVVNVVTKSGGEIDGLVLMAEGGTYLSALDDGTDADQGLLAAGESLGFTYGRQFSEKSDLVLWGGWFRAEGQRLSIPAAEDFSPSPRDGYAPVAAFADDASYDVGLRYQSGDVRLLANRRYGKYVEPLSAAGLTGEVYQPGDYRTFQSKGPGLGSASSHLEIAYAPSLSETVSLDLSGYYDTNAIDALVISNPARRAALFVGWNDDALGAAARLDWRYGAGGAGSGTLLVGGQVDRMRLRDSNLLAADGGDWVRSADTRGRPVLATGDETIYSGFTQVKHRFDERWIANAGLRLDVKDRLEGPNVTDVSPRVAVVWVAGERFDVKASYVRSFVDVPYWYRYNILPVYQGSRDLRPEHLQSFQLTPTLNADGGRLRASFNVFYNDVSDFVFRDNDAGPGEPNYLNAGALRSAGLEQETALLRDHVRVRGVLTYQRVVDSEAFDARDEEVFNVPKFVGNLVVDANPLRGRHDRFWINLALRYTSGQLAPIAATFRQGSDGQVAPFRDPGHRLEGYWLANVGLRLSGFPTGATALSATVFNLFDERYEQGGSVLHPYPQPGRSLVVGVTYRLSGR